MTSSGESSRIPMFKFLRLVYWVLSFSVDACRFTGSQLHCTNAREFGLGRTGRANARLLEIRDFEGAHGNFEGDCTAALIEPVRCKQSGALAAGGGTIAAPRVARCMQLLVWGPHTQLLQGGKCYYHGSFYSLGLKGLRFLWPLALSNQGTIVVV